MRSYRKHFQFYGKNMMADVQFVLTAEEKDYLVRLLENALKSDRAEMAHTDKRAYKEQVKNEIALVENLLARLKK
jgi:hypothetical protein